MSFQNKFLRFLILTLIGMVVYYSVGWFVFEFLIGDYTYENTTQLAGFKKEGNSYTLLLMLLSCGAYAALLSFTFVFLRDFESLVKSYVVGAVFGVLVAIMTDSYWYATSNFYSNGTVVLLDILAAGITVGFMALVVSFANKKLSK